jgi:tetratricopeptide (TPR) repeat protein
LILLSTRLRAATEALMASTARIDELKKKFDENPRRYFAPLANEFRKAGDIEQAIVICEEFLPQQPGHMSGHIVYGQALYEAGRLAESRTVFETALGLDPENLIALRHLGDIARGQSDHPAARNWYVRVLDADPRNEEIQALIASLDSESPLAEAEPEPEAVSFSMGGVELGLDIEKEVAPFEPAPEYAAPAPEPIDPSLADTAPLGVPIIPPPLHTHAPAASGDLLEGFSLHGFDGTPAHAATEHAHTPAEGLESTAFSPPEEPVPTAELDDSLDSGVPSFSAPSQRIESLAGLEGSGGMTHAEPNDASAPNERDELASLDLDDGLVLPPQGDTLAVEAHLPPTEEPAALESTSAGDLPFFDAPEEQGESVEYIEPVETSPEPAAAEAVSWEQSAGDAAPVELPPEVIAAEGALIDAGETPAPPAPSAEEMELAPEPVARQPFVTETMAELYLAQGFRDQALAVYVQLLALSPDDERLSGLVASFTPAEHATPAEDAGPNVRDFFARLAGRRAGARGAAATPPAYDDFALEPLEHVAEAEGPPEEAPYSVVEAEAEDEAQAEAEAESAAIADAEAQGEADADELAEAYVPAAPEVVAPAIERAAAMRTPAGSIDALFGNRAPGTSEDSAAAALAQAFGGEAEVPPMIAGRPAHTASGELSLDSVFRDGPRPPRTSQSFSFDQFFTGTGERSSGPAQRTSSELPMPGDAPAERSADDIEQFNSWLQGLKQR